MKEMRKGCQCRWPKIYLGNIHLQEGEEDFCRQLNRQVLTLCKSMPTPTQNDALFSLMAYSGIRIGDELNFFQNFYAPAWSIIYWLVTSDGETGRLSQEDIGYALMGHGMAMLLHSLDDHLVDGDMQVSHVYLLLRSQAWMLMKTDLERLSTDVPGGKGILQKHLDAYYASVCSREEVGDIEVYCREFRNRMATWQIAPALVMQKMNAGNAFMNAINNAYGSFGVAWRLVDDINDMAEDMVAGRHSAIYWCLPETLRQHWDKNNGGECTYAESGHNTILDYVLKKAIVKDIARIICAELESAERIASKHNVPGLSLEFRALLNPLRNF